MTSPLNKGERTKQKIIQTAIQLAAKYGFDETSFQMIANELKLSQSAVLYHFNSKNALFEELIRTIIMHNHQIVAGLMSIEDNAGRRLLKHCIGNILWALTYRQSDAQILILWYYYSCYKKEFAELFYRMIETGRKRILEHLLAGERENIFKFKAEPIDTAKAIQDNLFGAMLYTTVSRENFLYSEIEKKMRLLVYSFTGWEDDQTGPLIPPDNWLVN